MSDDSLKNKAKKGIYWTTLSQFATYGLQFVVGIVMARILSPSDYGLTAIPSVFISIAAIFIEGGFSGALIRKPEISERDLSTSFIYCASVGLFSYAILFFGAPLIANFYQKDILIPLIRVTAINFLFNPLIIPQNVLLQRKLDFKTPSRISIFSQVCGSVVGLLLALTGRGLWSLVYMSLVSSFLKTFIMCLVVRWTPKDRWSKDSFRYLWGFGNKLMLVGIIDKLYTSLSPLLIGKYYSVSDLGVYNRASGYSDLPSQQTTHIIQQVTFPILSKIQDDNEALATNYRRMLKMSAFVVFPIMVMISALAKPLILIFVTDKWSDAILLLQILCFSSMWYPIHAINLNLLQVKGRSDLFLKLEIYKKIIMISIMAVTLPFGIVYFVSSSIISSLLCVFINTYYTGKLIGIGYVAQMKDILPTLILSLISFGVTISITYFISSLWLQLIIGGLVGFGVYIFGAIILKFSELNDVKYMLNIKSVK